MPEWLEPMAATLIEERFAGPDWLFERKYDGIRLMAYKRGSDVQLFSRNRLPQHCPQYARRSRTCRPMNSFLTEKPAGTAARITSSICSGTTGGW